MLKKIGIYVLAILMILGAIGHLATPEFYAPLLPDFLPLAFANISAFIAELAIGVGLLIPSTRKWAGLGFAALMVVFLPLHILDLLKDEPMVGSKAAAVVRLVIQFGLIYVGWRIWKKS